MNQKINIQLKCYQPNSCQGFTVIELISVLVILGFLSVYAFNQFSTNNTDLSSVTAFMKNHIRYAQSSAMQSDIIVRGIRFDAALNEYWLFNCPAGQACSWTTNQTAPPGSESSPVIVDQNRLRLSLMNVNINQINVGSGSQSKLTLVYDEMGVPFWVGEASVTFLTPLSSTSNLNKLSNDITINLFDNFGNQKTITISPETGFVE
ncbi:MAG: prepilin-type N-terminal cleavage/methylation domain-containing protein [Pseudomonadota bacterium]